jgi:hypothetical protein
MSRFGPRFQDPAYVKDSRFHDLCVCQGSEVQGPLRMSTVSRFQDLRVCQGVEVPGPLRMSRFRGSRTCLCQGFEVPGPLRMSRSRGLP